MSVDAIRSALLQESLGRLGGAGNIQGLLAPTQTPLQAGLLGAMKQLQPYTGYTTTPTKLVAFLIAFLPAFFIGAFMLAGAL